MSHLRILSVLFIASLAAGAVALAACDTETASSAVIENGYPAVPDMGDATKQTVVYRGWWVATYFPDPVAGGGEGTEQRTVPGSDFAYAVLAPGWDPASGTDPPQLVIVKSKAPLSNDRGDTLRITVNDLTFNGNCAANSFLSQDDADFITQRIFPGEFDGKLYDPKTCTTTDADGGTPVEAGTDAAAADSSTDAPEGG